MHLERPLLILSLVDPVVWRHRDTVDFEIPKYVFQLLIVVRVKRNYGAINGLSGLLC